MGFFGNIGAADPVGSIRETIATLIRDNFRHEGTVLKYLPKPTVFMGEKNILTLGSESYPDLKYEFDLTPAVDAIIKFIKDSGVDMGEVRWDAINLRYTYDNHMWQAINIRCWVNKGKMTVRVYGPSYPINIYFDGPELGHYSSGNDVYMKFKQNFMFQEEVKVSPISVCMDLRTSLTKYINDLHSGKTNAIEVKKNIEDYIKKL